MTATKNKIYKLTKYKEKKIIEKKKKTQIAFLFRNLA